MGDQVVTDRQDCEGPPSVTCSEVIEFGSFHLDAQDTVPDHLLVQVRTFVVEDI